MSTVLIVPLWNWNVVCRVYNKKEGGVLIVPLWNWNPREPSTPSRTPTRLNCTFMELKYMITIFKNSVSNSLNCTFMELKYYILRAEVAQHGVLIVPLRNWNFDELNSSNVANYSLNHPFMELKIFHIRELWIFWNFHYNAAEKSSSVFIVVLGLFGRTSIKSEELIFLLYFYGNLNKC